MTKPARRRRTGRTLLILAVVLLVFCVGSVALGGRTIFATVLNSAQPPRDAATGFLDQLRAGQNGAAYQSLCSNTRDQFTEAQFAQVVNSRPKLTGYTVLGADVNDDNGRQSGSVSVRLTYADGSTDAHAFRLTRDADGWHVCGQPY